MLAVSACIYAKIYGTCLVSNIEISQNQSAIITFDFYSTQFIAADQNRILKFFDYRLPSVETLLNHNISDDSELTCIRWTLQQGGEECAKVIYEAPELTQL
ncbi:Hypothetical_protein [Hexamita inflata]|uniref:Hypothetical_protein n=1 Tax=Hexamita inflata TaxID=28002 RepID=A0AA86UMK0_9EUKA|nr:Hypothetical protein HINF_LOCUS44912 [Hexamita inflata]